MAVDHNNIVWINDHRSWGREAGTYIWGYDGNDGTLFTSEILTGGGLGGHSRSIAVDRNNIKWIGFHGDFHYSGGIVKYDDIVGIIENFPASSVKHVAVDNKNNLWVALYGGLLYYNGSDFISHNYTNGFPGKSPSAIAVDHNNILWAGIWIDSDNLSGIASFDGTTWVLYTTENSDLVSDTVYSIAVDNNNTKWIATDAGVSRFDGETWTTFNTKNSGLCNNKVNAIAVEKNNTIWFGTDNGVSKYTGEVITTGVDEK